MTLDEAIVHEKELAEENYMQGMLCHANPNDDELDRYIDNGRYHEQLAEWLEELKFIRQWKSDIMDEFCKYDVSSFEELVTNTRNKAIDDFVTKYKFCDNRSIQCRKALNCADCIAEQLKAGITNDWQRYPETSQEKAVVHF